MTKFIKETLLKAARRGGLFTKARRWSRRSLRILAYHGIWTTPGFQYGDHLFMPPAQFEQRMRWLKNSGYPVLPLDDAVKLLNEDDLPDNAVVITIDDGWASTYTHMLPVLEKFNLPATVYMTTWYSKNQIPVINLAVAYLLRVAGKPLDEAPAFAADINGWPTPDERDDALRRFAARLEIGDETWRETRQFHMMTLGEISDVYRRGLDFQLHTHRHRWGEAAPDQLSDEITENRSILASACCRADDELVHFCYPSGDLNPAGEDVLRQNGIKSATMVEQGVNPAGTHPYRLRRFLDGRSVSQANFEAYLSGMLEFYVAAIGKLPTWHGGRRSS